MSQRNARKISTAKRPTNIRGAPRTRAPPENPPQQQQPPSVSLKMTGLSKTGAEICQICMQIFTEPYSTVCGHTFCRSCIYRHAVQALNCPSCGTDLNPSNPHHLIPNHTAAALIENARRTRQSLTSFKRLASEMTHDFNQDYDSMEKLVSPLDSVETIESAILQLKRRRMELSLSEEKKKAVLLNEFFESMISTRNEKIARLVQEIQMLNADKNRVNEALKSTQASTSCRLVPEPSEENSLGSSNALDVALSASETEQIQSLKNRMRPNLNSLETCYFEIREQQGADAEDAMLGSLGPNLEKFSNILTGMSRYAKVRRLAALNYNNENLPNSSIVSSIEFDRDAEFFVVAGVSKKIKLYDFNAVVYGDSENHYPLQQLQCTSKISNISWNPYIKNVLASSDYEGTVQLWDTEACKSTWSYQEHLKRCWTVQFNNQDPHLFASGSDDGKVKIWSMNVQRSVATVDAKVNVCCVYFSPSNRHNFVFGSADHCVHLYDLRNTSKAVNVFRGHRKAVSYVKYCNENEIVSASTDSTLRLWDVKSGVCKQVMRGHQNEKNFVGLATDGNHVVCGSENNHLYVYYKHITDPLLRYDFATRQADPEISEVTLVPPEQQQTDFVSAVCWRKNSNILVSANSQGSTHILELL